jgi:hypothetical protein
MTTASCAMGLFGLEVSIGRGSASARMPTPLLKFVDQIQGVPHCPAVDVILNDAGGRQSV